MLCLLRAQRRDGHIGLLMFALNEENGQAPWSLQPQPSMRILHVANVLPGSFPAQRLVLVRRLSVAELGD